MGTKRFLPCHLQELRAASERPARLSGATFSVPGWCWHLSGGAASWEPYIKDSRSHLTHSASDVTAQGWVSQRHLDFQKPVPPSPAQRQEFTLQRPGAVPEASTVPQDFRLPDDI